MRPVCDQNSNIDGRCIGIQGSENFRE
jgi:hypothetical protein